MLRRNVSESTEPLAGRRGAELRCAVFRSRRANSPFEARESPPSLSSGLLECDTETRGSMSVGSTPPAEPSEHEHRHHRGHGGHGLHRRHRRRPAPAFARIILTGLAIILIATLAWKAVQFFWHRSAHTAATLSASLDSSDAARRADFWQREVLESIDAAAEESQLDNITGAEMDVDRATSLLESARVEASTAGPEFFEMTIAALDASLRPHADNPRLIEHVTLTRIELAQLRSFLAGGPNSAPTTLSNALNDASFSSSLANESKRTPDSPSSKTGVKSGHVMLHMPRSIAANHIFNPAAAGGEWLDAKPMPEQAEILLPPATRLLVDNVRVQNLSIEGASQTLDGVHWNNVTFVGTRVRYESGEVDLHNVHFERCTFGFTTDERGARLANAIALAQSSIVIN